MILSKPPFDSVQASETVKYRDASLQILKYDKFCKFWQIQNMAMAAAKVLWVEEHPNNSPVELQRVYPHKSVDTYMDVIIQTFRP